MASAGARLRPPAELFAFAVLAWAVGVCVYLVCLALYSGELPSDDALVATVWSAMVFFPLVVALYLPVAWCVSRSLQQTDGWPLALAGIALAPVAVTVLNALWSSRIMLPHVSSENLLFLALFAAAGAVVVTCAVE